jgi:hypothetical protein
MRLPKLEEPRRYVGLYVVDFGAHAGVGFTAEEVAELFESERYASCRAYKIHRACPDGRLELRGVSRQAFQLEAGLFFHAAGEEEAAANFRRLVTLAETAPLPCRAKVHLAGRGCGGFVVALIYPAEYDDEVSRWMLDNDFAAGGAVSGGTAAVSRYYSQCAEILRKRQFHAPPDAAGRSGDELMASVKLAVQR